MIYLKEYLEFVKKRGDKLNKYIRRAIEKQKRIHSKYIYRYDRVTQQIKWLEDNYYLTTGDLRQIEILPPQRWWLELMLGYDMIDENGKQVQLVNEVFLQLGRGSGKSSFMGGRALAWMILGNQYGGEGQVIAFDNNQARHVYEQIGNQTQASPFVRDLGDTNKFRSTKTGLLFEPTKQKFIKQTNDVNRAQGGNSSLNIFDEVHVYKDDITEAVNKGSRQKQDNWQSIYITSGGVVRQGLYDTMIDRFKSDEDFNNDRSIALIYALENTEQVKDKKNWSMALPMIGILPKWSSVEEEYEISKGDPALQTKFLAMNMGLQMNDTVYYFTSQETTKSDFDYRTVFDGQETYLGIDLSLVGDLTSLAFVTRVNGTYYMHTENFSTVGQFEALDNDQKDLWQKFLDEGSLHLLDSDYINVNDIIPYIAKFKEETGCYLRKVGYDPARYEILKELIERYFFDVDNDNQKPIGQGYKMSDYIKLYKQQIQDGNLKHNQELMQWSLMNASVKIGYTGDYMYVKLLDKEKIDPVVASTMALEMLVLEDSR